MRYTRPMTPSPSKGPGTPAVSTEASPRKPKLLTRFRDPFFLSYLAKSLIGTAGCYLVVTALPQYPVYWSIVSLLLVLAPDHGESMRLALDRMKANLAGAAVGLAALLIAPPSLLQVCLAVVATILLCEALTLERASRSALAALIIVMMTGNRNWTTALERVVCVVFGCLVAIALTWIFSALGRRPRMPRGPSTPED